MSRLVVAILILLAVLLGLRVANSSVFQSNAANQIDSSSPPPETRNTGFNTPATSVTSGGVVSQTGFNTPNQTRTAASTTPLPPRTSSVVPGNW